MTENLPVSWEDRMAADAKKIAERERPSISMINTKGGIMKIGDVVVPGNQLDVIILASAFENQWFKNKYDPNKRENPSCFALSLDGEGMAPHPEGTEIQFDGLCADCPNFEWGSDPKGGRGKACKEKRRLALLPATCLNDGNVLTAELALLTPPVTSVKNWSNYVNSLRATQGRPPWGVVTNISLHPHAKNQFEVRFSYNFSIGDQYLGDVSQRIAAVEEILMTPYEQNPEEKEPVPAATGKKAKY